MEQNPRILSNNSAQKVEEMSTPEAATNSDQEAGRQEEEMSTSTWRRDHSLVKIFGMVQQPGKSVGTAFHGWAGFRMTGDDG
jgi:hypothetical protein